MSTNEFSEFFTAPGRGTRTVYFVRWIKRSGVEDYRVYFHRYHLVAMITKLAAQGLPVAVWTSDVEWTPVDPATLTVTTREKA